MPLKESSGAIFDCFRTVGQTKVVKLTTPHIFDRFKLEGIDAKWGRVPPLREAQVLSNQLSDLQGSVVPIYYGIYAGVQPVPAGSRLKVNEMEVWAAVMEDAGDRVDVQTLTEMDK
jgi:hypothetical protein